MGLLLTGSTPISIGLMQEQMQLECQVMKISEQFELWNENLSIPLFDGLDLDGNMITTIIQDNLQEPRAISLHPAKG